MDTRSKRREASGARNEADALLPALWTPLSDGYGRMGSNEWIEVRGSAAEAEPFIKEKEPVLPWHATQSLSTLEPSSSVNLGEPLRGEVCCASLER